MLAIWMLLENNTYSPWPLGGECEPGLGYPGLTEISISGEIDIMESRGNGPAYPAQYAQCAELPFTLHYVLLFRAL